MSDSQRYPLKLCLIKYELNINVYIFVIFQYCFLYKSDLCIEIDRFHFFLNDRFVMKMTTKK